MTHHLKSTLLIFIPVVLAWALPSLATETLEFDSETPTVKDWPLSPRPKSEVFHMEVSEDGPPQKRLVFDCGKFALITGNYGNWEERDSTARFSFQLSPKSESDVTFGMARFPQNNFIESLNQEEWDAYVASLENNPSPKAIRNQRLSTDRKAAPMVLNEKPYRIIEYEQSDTNGNSTRTTELFTFIDDELFVFALSGPGEKIDIYRDRAYLMISRMNVLK